MTVSLLGVPFAVYNRQLFSTPFARYNQSGSLVAAQIDWSQYIGANSSFVVQAIFGASANVPNGFLPLSCYVNNLGSQVPIYVYFPDTGYEIVAPANSEGWYPVISNAAIAWVAGFNFVSGQLPLTTVFFTDLFVPPYVNVATPQSLQEGLASPAVGGNSPQLLSIAVDFVGQSYVNGHLAISGGGGSGASAYGTINEWGSFTAAFVLNGGGNFTGPPQVTATASNAAAAAFNPGGTYTVGEKLTYTGTEWKWEGAQSIFCGASAWTDSNSYPINAQVNYAGFIYICIQGFNRGAIPPMWPAYWTLIGSATPNTSYGWINSNFPGGTDAIFAATITSGNPSVLSGGVGPVALGDQIFAQYYHVDATGVFQDLLFGSPFGSGFIYISALDLNVAVISAGDYVEIQMNDSDGNVVFGPMIFEGGSPGPVLHLTGNIKLDATRQFQLNCTARSGGADVNIGFTWTWAQV